MKSTVFILLLAASPNAFANALPSPVVPEAQFHAEEIAVTTLPQPLRDALLVHPAEFTRSSGQLPETLVIRRFDLNQDREPEYIVDEPHAYSMGTAHEIFARRKHSYESIGSFQGDIRYLAAPSNGYYRICASVRHGGSYILQFRQGAYRPAH